MTYQVEFSLNADKQLSKLPKEIQVRIINSLLRIRIRPYPHVKKLVSNPFYRLRVGKYRLILDIKDDKLIIYVIEMGHRKNIYN